MPFTLVAYDKLKQSVIESIATLLDHHALDNSIPEESVSKLHEPRQSQARFLMTTIRLLDAAKINPEEKARILSAAAYHVHVQIKKSYDTFFKIPLTDADNSNFFSSLTTSLDLKKDNQPEAPDLLSMYGSLERFIRGHVFKAGDPMKGIIKGHPYEFKGCTYSVTEDLKKLIILIQHYKLELLVTAEKQTKVPSLKKPAGTVSLAGMFAESDGAGTGRKAREEHKRQNGKAKEEPENQPAP